VARACFVARNRTLAFTVPPGARAVEGRP
jgi:hypothetical protein